MNHTKNNDKYFRDFPCAAGDAWSLRRARIKVDVGRPKNAGSRDNRALSGIRARCNAKVLRMCHLGDGDCVGLEASRLFV